MNFYFVTCEYVQLCTCIIICAFFSTRFYYYHGQTFLPVHVCDFQRRINMLSFWYRLKRQVCDSKNITLSNRENNIFPFTDTDSSSMHLTFIGNKCLTFHAHGCSRPLSQYFVPLFVQKLFKAFSAVENDYSWLYFNLKMIHICLLKF